MSCIERCPDFGGKFIVEPAHLGHSKVSLYFRGVLYAGFHCTPRLNFLGSANEAI